MFKSMVIKIYKSKKEDGKFKLVSTNKKPYPEIMLAEESTTEGTNCPWCPTGEYQKDYEEFQGLYAELLKGSIFNEKLPKVSLFGEKDNYYDAGRFFLIHRSCDERFGKKWVLNKIKEAFGKMMSCLNEGAEEYIVSRKHMANFVEMFTTIENQPIGEKRNELKIKMVCSRFDLPAWHDKTTQMASVAMEDAGGREAILSHYEPEHLPMLMEISKEYVGEENQSGLEEKVIAKMDEKGIEYEDVGGPIIYFNPARPDSHYKNDRSALENLKLDLEDKGSATIATLIHEFFHNANYPEWGYPEDNDRYKDTTSSRPQYSYVQACGRGCASKDEKYQDLEYKYLTDMLHEKERYVGMDRQECKSDEEQPYDPNEL